MKTTYRERYDEVVRSGRYNGVIPKVVKLAEMIAQNHKGDDSYTKDDFIWMALEEIESMEGVYLDPTRAQFDFIKGWVTI